MERLRALRLTVALAALGLTLSGLTGSSAARAAPDVVYDAIGPTLPSNVPSLSFGSQLIQEFGDLVALAPGPRELTTVSVVLSTQACESGTGPTCVTAAGATFDHPLTMTLYNVAGTPAAPTVGSVIATLTDTFAIPFRPSADLVNCTGASAGQWFDGTICLNGLAVVVDFVFPAGTNLPDTVIWGIAYNTGSGGYSPVGAPGPYDSLNVGAFSVNPTVGTDVDEDMAFIADPATAGFVSELGWTGSRPMARIDARVPPTAPGPPSNVTATPGDGQVSLSWTAPPDGGSPITGYVISGGGTCAPTPATATSCVVTGLPNGVAVTFTVAAVNGVGTGPTATSPTVTPSALQSSTTTTTGATTTTTAAATSTTTRRPGGLLPATGSGSGSTAAFAFALVVVGAALVVGVARRRPDAH